MPMIYDRFTQDRAGNSLINTAIYPNPSVALASALTSGNIFFNGQRANAANGGTAVKLYSPSAWVGGSSYSHLDEIFNGTPNALMTYSVDYGEANHSPGPVTMGILGDMGCETSDGGSALPAPTGVSASDGTYSNYTRVCWNAVNDATSYELWRNTANNSATAARIADSLADTCYQDGSVNGTGLFWYWVKARNATETSAFSAADSGYLRGGAPTSGRLPSGYASANVSDLAVFDQNTGNWYIYSLAGSVVAWNIPWGWPGAQPVPGDYDGDGLSDLAVYDANTYCWYIRTVAGSVLAYALSWGGANMFPVPGDYNGDGVSDLAVFDLWSGEWHIRTVTGTNILYGTQWGWPNAWPVPGDYDVDGVYDLAVFDQNSGSWYIASVFGSVIAWNIGFGWPGAWPVSATLMATADSILQCLISTRASGTSVRSPGILSLGLPAGAGPAHGRSRTTSTRTAQAIWPYSIRSAAHGTSGL